jgi:tetratricopeptide (TPR) repeat protein
VEGNVPSGRRWLQILGIVLISVALLLALYGTVAYVAWQRGETLRVEDERRFLEEEVNKQMTLARDDVDSGNYQLAIIRLGWILEQRPDYPDALALQELALAAQNSEATPSPTPALAIAAPTATPLFIGPDPAGPYAELEELVADQRWQSAVQAINTFQAQFPDYERRETDAMLHAAYINYGLELVKGDQVELGLFYLSQAEKLGDLPTEVEDYRSWGELYLLGIGYYAVDWSAMIFYFRGLCAAAPFFQDACVKFRGALLAYADQYTTSQEWCPAEELYSEAYQLERDESVAEQLSEARLQCLEATPTPAVTITTTLTTQ